MPLAIVGIPKGLHTYMYSAKRRLCMLAHTHRNLFTHSHTTQQECIRASGSLSAVQKRRKRERRERERGERLQMSVELRFSEAAVCLEMDIRVTFQIFVFR